MDMEGHHTARKSTANLTRFLEAELNYYCLKVDLSISNFEGLSDG